MQFNWTQLANKIKNEPTVEIPQRGNRKAFTQIARSDPYDKTPFRSWEPKESLWAHVWERQQIALSSEYTAYAAVWKKKNMLATI